MVKRMNDESAPKPALNAQELTDQVAAFFERIGASDVCPVCGTTAWEVTAIGGYQPGLLMAQKDVPLTNMAYIPLIVANCERCGFLRSHLRSKVLGP